MSSSVLGYFLVLFSNIVFYCSSYMLMNQYQLKQIMNLDKCSKDSLARYLLIDHLNTIKDKVEIENEEYWIDNYSFQIIVEEEQIIGIIEGDCYFSMIIERENMEDEGEFETLTD